MFSRFRKFLVIGAGLALLAGLTAGPLSAASSNKTYTVAASPASLPYSSSGASGPLAITFTNKTPSASINSVTVTAPSGYSVTGPFSVTEGTGSAGNYNVSVSGQTISVTNLSPVGYLGTVSVSFTASTTASGVVDCTTNDATWDTAAWTGSNLGGNKFTLSGNPATTSIGSDLAVGATISTSGVSLTNNGTSCVPVTISRDANSVTILKPTSSSDNFTLDVLWDPEPAQTPMPATQTNTPLPKHAIPWCGGTAAAPALPNATDVSCLISEMQQIAGPDAGGNQQVQVHDVVYLLGDYSIVRG